MKERQTYYKAFQIAIANGERKEKDSQLKTLLDSCKLPDEIKKSVKKYYINVSRDVELMSGNIPEEYQ